MPGGRGRKRGEESKEEADDDIVSQGVCEGAISLSVAHSMHVCVSKQEQSYRATSPGATARSKSRRNGFQHLRPSSTLAQELRSPPPPNPRLDDSPLPISENAPVLVPRRAWLLPT